MKWPGNNIINIIKALVKKFPTRGRNSQDDRIKKGLEKLKKLSSRGHYSMMVCYSSLLQIHLSLLYVRERPHG